MRMGQDLMTEEPIKEKLWNRCYRSTHRSISLSHILGTNDVDINETPSTSLPRNPAPKAESQAVP